MKKKIHHIWILKRAIYESYLSSPQQSIALVVTILINGFLPLLSIYALSLLVGSISSATTVADVLPSAGLWVLSFSLPSFVASILCVQQSALSEKLFKHLSVNLMSTANSIKDLNSFEQEGIYEDIGMIKDHISSRPVNLIVNAAGIASDLISLLSISFSLFTITFISPAVAIVLGAIFFYVSSKSQSSLWTGLLRRSYHSRMMDYLFSAVLNKTNISEIRIHDAGDFFITKFKKEYSLSRLTMNKIRLYVFKLSFWAFILAIVAGLIMVWDVLRIMGGSGATPSQMIFLLQAILLIQMKTRSFSEQLGWMSGHLLFFEKYFDFSDRESQATKDKSTLTKNNFLDNRKIETLSLRDCTFAYGSKKPVIQDFQLNISRGEKIALVGVNGSGKTTITRLLLGLYAPQYGALYVNETKVNQDNVRFFWEKCVFIPQDYAKLHLTIKENVLLGRAENFPDMGVEKILGDSLWEKNNTQLGEEFNGVGLSGGQWQKLALLRAINNAQDKEILVFDEPTSSIDPLMESKIYDLIDELGKDKTAIFVTHRMSIASSASRIVLIDGGQILAEGHHTDLYENNAQYRNMYDSQAQMFKLLEA